MRLDKLRGYGPWFAFAVPFLFLMAMLLFVIVNATIAPTGGPAPAWLAAIVAVWLILWGLIVLAGLVVAIDLEWIEHPRTNTPMTYVALGGMVVATVTFLLFLLDGVLNLFSGNAYFVEAFLISAGFGVYLVVINLVGQRAGLLGRVLPWLGVVSGTLFLIAALLILVGLPEGAGFGFFPGAALYLGWSLWLGFRLRGKAPEAAVAAA